MFSGGTTSIVVLKHVDVTLVILNLVMKYATVTL